MEDLHKDNKKGFDHAGQAEDRVTIEFCDCSYMIRCSIYDSLSEGRSGQCFFLVSVHSTSVNLGRPNIKINRRIRVGPKCSLDASLLELWLTFIQLRQSSEYANDGGIARSRCFRGIQVH